MNRVAVVPSVVACFLFTLSFASGRAQTRYAQSQPGSKDPHSITSQQKASSAPKVKSTPAHASATPSVKSAPHSGSTKSKSTAGVSKGASRKTGQHAASAKKSKPTGTKGSHTGKTASTSKSKGSGTASHASGSAHHTPQSAAHTSGSTSHASSSRGHGPGPNGHAPGSTGHDPDPSAHASGSNPQDPGSFPRSPNLIPSSPVLESSGPTRPTGTTSLDSEPTTKRPSEKIPDTREYSSYPDPAPHPRKIAEYLDYGGRDKVTVYLIPPRPGNSQEIIAVVSAGAVCADGARFVYSDDPKAPTKDNLRYKDDGKISGVVYNDKTGKPYRDPEDPRYFVSGCSGTNPNIKNEGDPRRYPDAEKVPYTVVPTDNIGNRVKLFDSARITNLQNGRSVEAPVLERGPQKQFGEASIAAHQTLDVKADAKGGGTGSGVNNHTYLYTILPGTAPASLPKDKSPWDPQDVNTRSEQGWKNTGWIPEEIKREVLNQNATGGAGAPAASTPGTAPPKPAASRPSKPPASKPPSKPPATPGQEDTSPLPGPP
jgi:hypothetical protein